MKRRLLSAALVSCLVLSFYNCSDDDAPQAKKSTLFSLIDDDSSLPVATLDENKRTIFFGTEASESSVLVRVDGLFKDELIIGKPSWVDIEIPEWDKNSESLIQHLTLKIKTKTNDEAKARSTQLQFKYANQTDTLRITQFYEKDGVFSFPEDKYMSDAFQAYAQTHGSPIKMKMSFADGNYNLAKFRYGIETHFTKLEELELNLENITIRSQYTESDEDQSGLNILDACLPEPVTSVVLPSELKEIGNYVFSTIHALKSLTIGGQPKISTCAFYSVMSEPRPLDIILKSKVPFDIVIDRYPFGANMLKYATLIVPKGTLEAYKAHKDWSKFENIKEE